MQLYHSVQAAGTMADAGSKSSLDEEGVQQVTCCSQDFFWTVLLVRAVTFATLRLLAL